MGRVSFSPKQPGTGLPSPTNICPIYPGLTIDGIGDIYGGYLDVYNAEVVETDTYAVLDDESKWYDFTTRAFGYNYNFTDRETGSNSTILATIAPNKKLSSDQRDWWARWDSTSGYIAVVRWVDGFDAPTMDEIKALSTAGNIAISYPLATPIHHSLTTAQLRQAMQQLGVASQSVASSRHIVMNAPHVETPTPAGLLTFNTDMAAPLKSCRVSFHPKQLGSGDPSPSNVLPITGWTGCNCFSNNNIQKVIIKNFQSETLNGITTLLNADGSLTFKGTSTATCVFNYDIEPIVLSSGMDYDMMMASANTVFNKNDFVFQFRSSENTSIMALFPETDSYWGDAVASFNPSDFGGNIYTATKVRFILTSGFKDVCVAPYLQKMLDCRCTSIDWTTEAGTVYDGYVDLVNGVVANYYRAPGSPYTNYNVNYVFDSSDVIGAAFRLSADTSKPVYCDSLPVLYEPNPNFAPYLYAYASNGYWYLVMVPYKVSEFPAHTTEQDTKSIVQNWYESNNINISVLIPRSSPTTYQLTPTILKTLRGANHIWSSANGNVELSYWKH